MKAIRSEYQLTNAVQRVTDSVPQLAKRRMAHYCGQMTATTSFVILAGTTRLHLAASLRPVSYTHLDVYKRQKLRYSPTNGALQKLCNHQAYIGNIGQL